MNISIIKQRHKKILSSGYPTRSDTNQAVQPQKMARGLRLRIGKLRDCPIYVAKIKPLICGFVFTYAKIRFTHDAPNIMCKRMVHNENYNVFQFQNQIKLIAQCAHLHKIQLKRLSSSSFYSSFVKECCCCFRVLRPTNRTSV